MTNSVFFFPLAVVFVVDSSHRDRVSEAHSELAKLLTEKELREALLLIFANKQVTRISEYYLVVLFILHYKVTGKISKQIIQ